MNHTGVLLSSREAAERIGVSRDTVERLVSTGALTPVQKLPGRTGAYLFTGTDVDAVAESRRPVTSQP